MYKAVFKNRKIALLFVAMTLFSAIRMVGSSEDAGVLAEATNLARDAGDRSAGSPISPAAAGGGVTAGSDPVFGDYVPEPKPAPAAAR